MTVTLPGGNTAQTSYNGSLVTITDQVNRQIRRESDGLGRLIKVTEQDVASGALTQETTYTYDAADRLTLVNQGNQTRAFKYDAEGRLLYERIPEQSATINDGTGTMWTTKYTYTDWGAVATKQDARGVVTTYGYDTLHRLTSLSYNTSGAPGVAATPSVTYTYDTNNNSATKGLLLAVAVGSVYSESYSYDSFKRVQAMTRTMGSRSYTTSYQLDTANQLTQLTYPSNRVLTIGHDAKGRVSSIGSYLSSVTYNGIGQVTGISLGNGVSESYGYDANRMQLTTQTATKSGGAQNGLMNLTYGYNATAGQMGAGSTAGNAGQVMSVSGTINSTTEAASYTYDNLGRLVTSTQSSNLSLNAQRRFAYDRWGNRTGVWDATSGGNQLQSVTLQQSGGVPTNRIASVTAGTTVNYSYDATGNVTNDGAHSYTYDAENRIVSVDAGAAQYVYDQQNRRVKKVIGSSTTHYVWEGAQVLAEHNGSTGALIADYIYSGSRMVAKVAGLNTQYFLSDRLSVRLTLDASGNVVGRQAHLPFGEDFAESGTQQKQHFTSYERDSESGTDYAINRQYNQGIGRFNRSDPYSGSYTLSEPQSLNRYSYVKNEPIGLTDPSGLDDFAQIPGSPGSWPSWYPNTLHLPSVPTNDYFNGGWNTTIPTPSFDLDALLAAILAAILPGTLTVDPMCDSVVYLPESDNTAWKWPPGGNNAGSEVYADFVATPRGIIKFGNGCSCDVSCSGGDRYIVTCKCKKALGGIGSKAEVQKRARSEGGEGKAFPKFKGNEATWVETDPPLYEDLGRMTHPGAGVDIYVFGK